MVLVDTLEDRLFVDGLGAATVNRETHTVTLYPGWAASEATIEMTIAFLRGYWSPIAFEDGTFALGASERWRSWTVCYAGQEA